MIKCYYKEWEKIVHSTQRNLHTKQILFEFRQELKSVGWKNHQRTQNFKCLYLHYRIRGEERDADWLRITFWGELCMSVRPFGIIKILLMAKVFLNRFNRLKFYSLCIFPYCSCGAGDLDTANINISLDAKWNIPNLVHICSDLHIDSYHICGVE